MRETYPSDAINENAINFCGGTYLVHQHCLGYGYLFCGLGVDIKPIH